MGSTQKHIELLLVDAVGAAELISVGKTLFYEMDASGRLGPKPIKFNSKKLYSVKELREWVFHKCPARERWIEIQKGRDGNN